MDATQWPQEASLAPPSGGGRPSLPAVAGTERRFHRQNDQPLNCPRCNSTNTKFCYYNNYSLSQPRYFCKTCRRYWTAGGSLRNVPVGGGSRKNKRSEVSAKPAVAAAASSSSIINPKFREVQDLSLGFSRGGGGGLPELNGYSNMDLLRGVEMDGGLPGQAYMTMPPHEVYAAGFGTVHDFRGRSDLGLGFQMGSAGVADGDDRKVLFPAASDEGGNAAPAPAFWNGMLGGGDSW